MKIGLISDSHDHIDNIRKAVQVFKQRTGKTLSLNPGSAHGFGEQATVMVLDTTDLDVDLVTL